jgi:hypothetical protein
MVVFSIPISIFSSFSCHNPIVHAIIPLLFILIMQMRLWPGHMNMFLTLTLETVVTDTWPPWNIVLMTE